MANKKSKKSNKNEIKGEFKSKVVWNKYKLRPGSKRYNTMIKNRFSIAKNNFYETLSDSEKSARREAEMLSDTSAKTYEEFSERQSAYRRAVNKLYHDRDFITGSQEERVKMMSELEPSLASAVTNDGKSLDLSMSLLAYEDRERAIDTGLYAVIRAKEYVENYQKAISASNMPVPKHIREAMASVPDDDLVYFIDELLPPLPDWYGLNGSTLMPAIEFIQKLQSAIDFYNSQKGNK